MRLVGWQQDDLAGGDFVFLAGDSDAGLALKDMDQGVIRSGVLAQPLPGIEGEQGHSARGLVHQRPADYGVRLNGDHGRQFLW